MTVALLLAVVALAVVPYPTCDDPQNQQTINRCAHTELECADGSINHQWKVMFAV